MCVTTLLADPTCLRLERAFSFITSITLVARATASSAACPQCGTVSKRIHSRYVRKVADLPWHGVPVRLELHTRKFFCISDACPQRIFTERLPRVVEPHARRTRRLNEALALATSVIEVIKEKARSRRRQVGSASSVVTHMLHFVQHHPLNFTKNSGEPSNVTFLPS